ncbi:MAG: hypothetical protein QXD03_04735 [Candidatus Anstonellales archaeon]
MSNKVVIPVKTFTGNEIVPFSSIYNDKAVLQLGLLPSYINDFIKTTMPRFIHGFEILSHNVDDNNIFSIRLSPGCCILNKSVAFVKTDTYLTLRVGLAWLDYQGYIVSDFYYSKSRKTYNMSIYFVREDGEILPLSTEFNPDDDHVIVALIKLKMLGQNIVSVDVTKKNIRRGLRIMSKTCYVYGHYPITSDVDAGEILSAIVASNFIVPVMIDNETVTFELVNTDNIPISFSPSSYYVNDQTIFSHLSGIDSEIKENQFNMDVITITEEIYNSGLYINTTKKIDFDRFDKSMIFVHNGIGLIPNEDYIYNNENSIRIINENIMVGDILNFCYYYKIY